MHRRLAWLLGAALASMGCDDRRAGTEVGNPEITVSAMARVYDDYDSVEVSSLQLNMMGMSYVYSGKESVDELGHCWKYPGGILLDLARDTGILADTMIEEGKWSRAEIVLRTPEGPAVPEMLADYRTWNNARYVKFNIIQDSPRDTLPSLFEWPQGVQFRLVFVSATVSDWRWYNEVWVPIEFFVSGWTKSVGAAHREWTYRKDGQGARYILFSPQENPATWADLKNDLPDCFGSDSLIMH